MNKVIFLLLVVSIFLAGCAGREASPDAMNISVDENRNYQSPPIEMSQTKQERDVLPPKINKFVADAAWAATSVFFPIPILLSEFERSHEN